MTTHRIHRDNLERLDDLIEGLNKKAAKCGCPPVGYRVVGEVIERRFYASTTSANYRLLAPNETAPEGLIKVVPLVDVEPFGEAPVIAGYRLAARIEHHGDAGNIINRNPAIELELPARFRTVGPECDHCMLKMEGTTHDRDQLFHRD